LQVITGVEFNCMAAMQGTHHIVYLIEPTLSSSERRTSQPYRGYGTRTLVASTQRQCYPPLYGPQVWCSPFTML